MIALQPRPFFLQASLFAVFLFLFSCTQQPQELTPKEKFEAYHQNFLRSWTEANPLFQSSSQELQIEIIEKNATALEYSANLFFPLNWTEFQYMEESDFAQGYEFTIQMRSRVEVIHEYRDGNWTFASARQYDFNSTMIEHLDDYSETIGNAWMKRLPTEKTFEQKELFIRIPPNRDYSM